MTFTINDRERFILSFKASLLGAAILLLATAPARSEETNGAEPPGLTQTTTTDDSSATTTEIKPADRQKALGLSRHIQHKYRIPAHKANQIVQEAIDNGRRHSLDPELILALIAVESTFKERAVSRVGARGLMQVMPGSHRRKVGEIGGTHALFDPVKNIHVGSRILVKYLDAHSGDLRRALLSYNGSLGTRSSFPDRVMRIYRDLRRVTTES